MKITKANWRNAIIGILVFFIFIPLVLNYIISQTTPNSIQVVGEEKDWLLFWATYIGASATAIMAWLTYKMFKQNKELLDAQQERWETERKGILVFTIVFIKHFYCLEIRNIGLSVISNLSISIDDNFIERLPIERIRIHLKGLKRKKILLKPSENKTFFIFPTRTNDKYQFNEQTLSPDEIEKTLLVIENESISITGSYESIGKKYEVYEEFTLKDFAVGALLIDHHSNYKDDPGNENNA